jgi:hypothetical protein
VWKAPQLPKARKLLEDCTPGEYPIDAGYARWGRVLWRYTVRATNVHGFPMRTVNEPRRDTTNGCNPLGGCQCFKS